MFKFIVLICFSIIFSFGCESRKEIKNGCNEEFALDTNVNGKHSTHVWDGEIYHGNANVQYDWVKTILSQLRLKGDEYILDIGTGTGKIAAELSNKVPKGQVIAMDSSVSMLKKAQNSYPKQVYPNLLFVKQDALEATFERPFDVVISFWVLHWIKKKEDVFRNVYRNLKQGGKALFYFGPNEGENRLDQAIAKVASQAYWPKAVRNLKSGFFLETAKTTHTLLVKLGFKVLHFKVVVQEEYFSSKEKFTQWLRSWLPHLVYLTKAKQIQFMEAVIKEYRQEQKEIGQEKGIKFLDYMLEIVVEK